MINQEIQIQKSITKQEKAKRLPDFILGISNSSFRGFGPDNVNYDASNRFTSFQFGTTLPLFNFSQKNRIQSAKLAEDLAQKQAKIIKNQLNNEFLKLYNQLQTQQKIISTYEKEYLPSANELINLAMIQFQKGEINYLDFVMLVNQSFTTKNNYLDLIYQFNKNALEFNYLPIKP